MKKKIGTVGKFFAEFKKFITRGNVLDMSVGVIVGGAFTGIVNGLTNYILKPLINWLIAALIGTNGLEGAITMLSPAYTEAVDANGVATQVLDLANSIYIDWGAFISAIINFLIIAFVLFSIVKLINRLNEAAGKAEVEAKSKHEKNMEILKICMEESVKRKKAIEIYEERCKKKAAEKAAKDAEEAAVAAAKEAEEKRIAEERANANTVLLQEILDVLKSK